MFRVLKALGCSVPSATKALLGAREKWWFMTVAQRLTDLESSDSPNNTIRGTLDTIGGTLSTIGGAVFTLM